MVFAFWWIVIGGESAINRATPSSLYSKLHITSFHSQESLQYIHVAEKDPVDELRKVGKVKFRLILHHFKIHKLFEHLCANQKP